MAYYKLQNTQTKYNTIYIIYIQAYDCWKENKVVIKLFNFHDIADFITNL